MGGNKNAFPYALLEAAGIDTEGLDPYHAWKKAEELGLLGSKERAIKKAENISKDVIYRGGNPLNFEKVIDNIQSEFTRFGLNKLLLIETVDSIPGLGRSPAGSNGGNLILTKDFLENPDCIYDVYKDDPLKDGFTRCHVLYDDPIKTVIYHELGHIVGDQFFGSINNSYIKSNISEEEAKDRYFDVCDCYEKYILNGNIKNISQRASKNEREFFAEVFCMYMMKDEKLPQDIYDMIERVCK